MTPKGTVLIIGGAEDKGDENEPDMAQKNKEFEHFEILREILPKDNGSKKKIEIIATASSVPDEMNQSYKKAFAKLGYKNVDFIKIESKEEARNQDFAKRIHKAHAVLFTGGDQFSLSAILGGTPTIAAIKEKYYHDKDFVVAGTSAGAMAMTKIMIYEGGINEALLMGDLKMSSGLGIFDTCIIDTHFIKRGRFGRLANAIVMNPESLGIGLGEDTVMIIKKGDQAECRGSGTIIIIDGEEIGQTNITDAERDSPIFVGNLKVHILSKGCRFSIKERKLMKPAIRKKALTAST
jgi:cyanophycinase